MTGAVGMTTKNTIIILQNHWDSLREGKLPPFRSEISPRDMPDVLDTMFILERVREGDTRVRIAGLTICELMGMEARGLSPTRLFNEEHINEIGEILESVMNEPSIAYLELEFRDAADNRGLMEMVLLPLRSDFGDVSRIIGCVTEPDKGFTPPVSFDILTAELSPIGKRRRYVSGFAEEGTPFTPRLQSIEGSATGDKKPNRKKTVLKVVD